MKLLSRSEEIVLLSIWKLQENAYGVTILEEVRGVTGNDWSIGAIYAPLHRLEKKGLVKTYSSEPVQERGGRSRVHYVLTNEGKKALIEIKRVHEATWTNIVPLELEAT